MVKYIYIFFFVVLIHSCASRKKSDSHLSASSVSNIGLNKKVTIDSDINRIDWSKVISSIDMDIYIRRYDMTAQPDSAGNYPLKEEESIKGKYDSQAEQQTASNQSKHENSDTNYSARLQNNIEASQISDSSLGTGSVFNLNWLWLFIVPVVIFLFIKKVKNKK